MCSVVYAQNLKLVLCEKSSMIVFERFTRIFSVLIWMSLELEDGPPISSVTLVGRYLIDGVRTKIDRASSSPDRQFGVVLQVLRTVFTAAI